MVPDLILTNATILTQDPSRPRATSVGIWNGLICGLDDELDFSGAEKIVDLHGATITPGFNDAHAHSVWFGQTLIEVDLSDAKSESDILQAISSKAQSLPQHEWVVCSNYNPLALTTAPPTLDAMDQATQGRPLLIKHASGHAYTVNGIALQQAGIPEYPDHQPEGGKIVTDENGRATGLLDENAMRAVQDLLQPEALSELETALEAASSHYASEGLTSVTDAGIAGGWIGHSPREFAAYQRVRDRGLLKHRAQTMITLDALHELPGHTQDPQALGLDAGIRSGIGDNVLSIGPVKVFTDGSLLGATAAMTEAYAHCQHNHGYLQQDPAVMREKVLQAAAGGWALALHAIGDAAVEFAIDTIKMARQHVGPGPLPDRIEHGGVASPSQIGAMAKAGIALVPQPYFIAAFGDGMIKNLGADRTHRSYPAASLLQSGMVLPGSSDRPVTHGAPLAVMQAFVQRLTESGQSYAPDERISIEQALYAYTAGSAQVTGRTNTGVLAPGKLADLVVLGQNPLKVPTSEINNIEIRATLMGGTQTFGQELS
ncbi:amidohydrolase [Auritidibacter sp. NML120636]|uniref:amidohydrolase n=1 Tax=Auritidibacter sp. NML120636 TaxID=2170743 RepID=UPI000D726F1D|nr:amidohydrolase [Auritidibacter sp. NML120636]PXA79032.1 amidohydrolase [Auritidibacter sp. NML120636]